MRLHPRRRVVRVLRQLHVFPSSLHLLDAWDVPQSLSGYHKDTPELSLNSVEGQREGEGGAGPWNTLRGAQGCEPQNGPQGDKAPSLACPQCQRGLGEPEARPRKTTYLETPSSPPEPSMLETRPCLWRDTKECESLSFPLPCPQYLALGEERVQD